MHFMLAGSAWHCQFLEENLKTSLRRKLTFQDSAKIVEMAERGGDFGTLADRQGVEHGISMGRGAAWLKLTEEQYGKLISSRST